MVDVVVNNVMATSTTPDLSNYLFKNQVSSTAYLEMPLMNLWYNTVAIPSVLPHPMGKC
jgi:hypothetical protein